MVRTRDGFTLPELLIFVAIFSAVMVGFITVLVTITRVQTRQSSSVEISSQSQFLLQQIQYYIQSARLVDMLQDSATSTLSLRMATSSLDPTSITLSAGIVYLRQGAGGALQPLTSNKVTVSSISFTRRYSLATSTAYGTDSVSYSFTMAVNTSNITQQYSQSFRSSAAVFAPVPKIALVQQAKGEVNSLTVASVTSTFASNNATGSLLIAVVSDTGPECATGVSDNASNTWTQVALSNYSAYGQETIIFNALNAKNSSNTVTASFPGCGLGVSYPSLFIYEYRGAATSSSFDASSTQNISATSSPSSGLANPTSTIELIFGVLYSNPSTETPTAGSGFTLLTTSTVSATYVEDKNLYVTGPVSADWKYSQTAPSSSAIVVTFR